jgi:hypothetical protein
VGLKLACEAIEGVDRRCLEVREVGEMARRHFPAPLAARALQTFGPPPRGAEVQATQVPSRSVIERLTLRIVVTGCRRTKAYAQPLCDVAVCVRLGAGACGTDQRIGAAAESAERATRTTRFRRWRGKHATGRRGRTAATRQPM